MRKPHSIDGLVFWFALLIVGVLFTVVIAMAQDDPPGSLDSAAQINVDAKNSNKRQAPPISAHAVHATAPCLVSTSGAGSGPGIGLAFGKTSEDEGCTMREDIRTLISVGMVDEARRLACFLPSLDRVSLRVECLQDVSP